MNRDIALRVTRIGLYLVLIRKAMARKNPVDGMAHSAELAEQARRLYEEFAAENRKRSDQTSS